MLVNSENITVASAMKICILNQLVLSSSHCSERIMFSLKQFPHRSRERNIVVSSTMKTLRNIFRSSTIFMRTKRPLACSESVWKTFWLDSTDEDEKWVFFKINLVSLWILVSHIHSLLLLQRENHVSSLINSISTFSLLHNIPWQRGVRLKWVQATCPESEGSAAQK